jgi:TIR domain/Effector-associated domain 11
MNNAEIRRLLINGNIDAALELLAQFRTEALLLQGRWQTVQRKRRINVIRNDEYEIEFNQILIAAFDLLSEENQSDISVQPVSAGSRLELISSVDIFISYHETDKYAAGIIGKYIKEQGFHVITAREVVDSKQDVRDFIENHIKNQGFVLSLVSKNSLLQGWMGVEKELAYYAGLFESRHFIAIALDNSYKDTSFVYDALYQIDDQLEDIYEKKIIEKQYAETLYIKEREEVLSHLRNFLPLVAQRVKNHYFINIFDLQGEQFEARMQKVVKTIRSWQADTNKIISKNFLSGSAIKVENNLKIGE